jgi:hypothetical protein
MLKGEATELRVLDRVSGLCRLRKINDHVGQGSWLLSCTSPTDILSFLPAYLSLSFLSSVLAQRTSKISSGLARAPRTTKGLSMSFFDQKYGHDREVGRKKRGGRKGGRRGGEREKVKKETRVSKEDQR